MITNVLCNMRAFFVIQTLRSSISSASLAQACDYKTILEFQPFRFAISLIRLAADCQADGNDTRSLLSLIF